MKNFKDLKEYILNNKYVIALVMLSTALLLLGVLKLVSEFIVFVALVIFSIYFGKKIQEDDSIVKSIFENKNYKKQDNIYYYQEKETNTETKTETKESK